MATPTLGTLPSELILLIGHCLEPPALNALLQSVSRFHGLLQNRLYQLACHYRNVPGAGTPLIWAVQKGQTTVLKAILNAGASPSGLPNRKTPLHEAIRCNNTPAFQLLLEAGADILAQDSGIPVELAASLGQQAFVQDLLDAHQRIQEWDAFAPHWAETLRLAVKSEKEALVALVLQHPIVRHGDRTRSTLTETLHEVASITGKCSIMQLLCDYGADPLRPPPSGSGVLHQAAMRGHINAVEWALQQGLDPAAFDGRGRTSALHYAAAGGHVEVIRVLLDAGVDVDIRSQTGATPLMKAAEGPVGWAAGESDTRMHAARASAARVLLDAGANIHAKDHAGFNAVDAAVTDPEGTDVLEVLLEHGADAATAPATPRMTPLHWAARLGNARAIHLLCRAGASVDRVDQRGRTALHLAAREGRQGAVDALLRIGADVSVREETDSSPLHFAAMGGDVTIAADLLSAKADALARDSTGHTPLHIAAISGQTDMCRLLLRYCRPGPLNALTGCADGYSVLEEAVEHGHQRTVDLLLGEGLDPTVGWQSSSALHIAAARGWTETVSLLLKHGADPHALDLYGRSALDWAMASTRRETVDVIRSHCTGPDRTDPEVRRSQLRRTVARIGRRLLASEQSAHSCNGCTLGKALLYLDEDEDARLVYASHRRASLSGSDRHDRWFCAGCRRSPAGLGVRFVCRSCRDIELCEPCMTEYSRSGREVLGCQGHEYLDILEHPPDLSEMGESGLDEETAWKRWLGRLVTVYED